MPSFILRLERLAYVSRLSQPSHSMPSSVVALPLHSAETTDTSTATNTLGRSTLWPRRLCRETTGIPQSLPGHSRRVRGRPRSLLAIALARTMLRPHPPSNADSSPCIAALNAPAPLCRPSPITEWPGQRIARTVRSRQVADNYACSNAGLASSIRPVSFQARPRSSRSRTFAVGVASVRRRAVSSSVAWPLSYCL